MDFRYATGVPVPHTGDTDDGTNLSIMARFFSAASKRVCQLCQKKDAVEWLKHTYTMSSLNLPMAPGIQGRAVLMRPEKVNQAVHKIAVLMATGQIKETWSQPIDLPDAGDPQWKVDLPQELQEKAKRKRGKQRGQDVEVAVQMPADRVRARPSVQLIAPSLELEEEETQIGAAA